MYKVYETDADDSMEEQKLIHSGWSKDIAETRMYLRFQASGGLKDFLLYNNIKKVIVANCMSFDTARKRGICQG